MAGKPYATVHRNPDGKWIASLILEESTRFVPADILVTAPRATKYQAIKRLEMYSKKLRIKLPEMIPIT